MTGKGLKGKRTIFHEEYSYREKAVHVKYFLAVPSSVLARYKLNALAAD
jgi:hypothetical protein